MKKDLVSFNRTMGFVHLVQGTVMMVLAFTVDTFANFKPMVVGYFFGPIEGGYGPIPTDMFELPFAVLVASFLLLSALFHFVISGPYAKTYVNEVSKGINSLRWIEYAFSSSLMIVLLAVMFGLSSIEAIIGVFALNAVMNLLGLLMEKMNPPERSKTDWTAHVVGWIAGLVPWVLILIYLFNIQDLTVLPWFVIPGLTFYFLTFNLFAFNQILQYAKVGPWKDYAFGERTYVWLSLFGKSILAWFVLIGILLA